VFLLIKNLFLCKTSFNVCTVPVTNFNCLYLNKKIIYIYEKVDKIKYWLDDDKLKEIMGFNKDNYEISLYFDSYTWLVDVTIIRD
jgi:hypothetical protein